MTPALKLALDSLASLADSDLPVKRSNKQARALGLPIEAGNNPEWNARRLARQALAFHEAIEAVRLAPPPALIPVAPSAPSGGMAAMVAAMVAAGASPAAIGAACAALSAPAPVAPAAPVATAAKARRARSTVKAAAPAPLPFTPAPLPSATPAVLPAGAIDYGNGRVIIPIG